MSAIKSYFKEEIQLRNLGLEHSKPPDFYLSVWQRNRSSVPLLVVRTLIFLASLGIVIASITLYIQDGLFKFWFIYLTHWGLTVMTLASLFAVVVSARCYIYGPLSEYKQNHIYYLSKIKLDLITVLKLEMFDNLKPKSVNVF